MVAFKLKPSFRARYFVCSLVACLGFVTGGAIDAQTFTNGAPPAGTVGIPYSFTFTATGPSCSDPAIIDFSATGLPSGLSIDISGNVAGTPTTPTTALNNVMVTATDTSCTGLSATKTYTITIAPSAQPANTTAYVVNQGGGSIVQVAGGFGTSFEPSLCECSPVDFARDPTTGNLILAIFSELAIYPATGGTSPAIITASQLATLGGPGLFPIQPSLVSVSVDASGHYIVVDNANYQFVQITVNASLVPTAVTQIASFSSYVDANSTGDAYVRLDHNTPANYVLALDDSGATSAPPTVSMFLVASGSTSATCGPGPALGCTSVSVANASPPRTVRGLTVDGSGNYVITDDYNESIYSISPSGGGSTVIFDGSDTLGGPAGIYYDALSGDFLFVDQENAVLYTLGPAGCVTTCSLNTVLTGGLLNSPDALVVVDTIVPPVTTSLTITLSPSSISTTTGGSVLAFFAASGGAGGYTYSLSGQPAGVTLGSGTLSGTPTQAGNFNATLTVTDSSRNSASATITINVLGLATTMLPTGTVGEPYAFSIVAAGGTPIPGPAPIPTTRRDVGASPPTYSFSATGLPAGMSLTSYGYLNGTVKTAGTYPLSITLSSGGLSVTTVLNLMIVNPGPLSISSASLPGGTVNVLYSQALGATGGLPPYTWSVIAGSLPQGLSLSTSGIVSGTPGTPGSFSFGVEVSDTAGAITTATASLTIQPATLTITTQSLPAGMKGVDYPQQQLAATGGVSPYTWALSSGASLPSGLAFSSSGVLNGVPTVTGTFSIGVTVTDQAKTQASVTYSLTIRQPSNDLILTSSSLTFSLSNPAASLPASQVVGVQSTVASQPITYTLAVSPAAPWLALANGTATPDTITVSLTPAALTLSPGPYQTTIAATCTSSFCSGHAQTISVNLTVTALPAQLQISTGLVSFATPNAALGPLSQPINIQNAGGGSLGFASISCEASWCTAGPLPSGSGGSASLAGGASAEIPVTVNPGLLTPGFYRTQVDIASSAGTGAVPVTLFISANATVTLAPAGELFNQPAGSAPGNPNGSFLVSVNSPSPVNFTAAIITVPGIPPASWLVLGTASGSASSTQPGTVSFSINPVAAAALAPGGYYGEIQVTSPSLSNSPENFEVVLNVAAANTPVVPDAEPGGLLFITAAGGGVLPPQTVTVYSGSASASTFQTSAATTTGSGWLSVTPNTGSTSATAPGVTTVSVNTSMLTPGVYQGGVSYSLSATAVRTVNVTLIVESSAGASASAVSSNEFPHASSCAPSVLVPTQTGLVNSFSQPAGWPTPLQIVLSNDCGSTVNNGQIVATFSNGDPPLALPLANPSQGLYSGTWAPARPSSEVAINITANAPGFPQATSQIAGAVVPNAVPVLTPNGTLHVFDSLIGGALAPGTIVAIYGQNLAATAQPTTTIPLPNTLNSTSVVIGGSEAPIYFVSPGQINAQIPFELPAGNQYEVIVSANGALTTPQPIQLAAATPGLAALSDGTLIAQHSNGSLVSQMAPARAGEYLVVYLAGLGDTTVPVASGTASPSNPLAQPSVTPTLTINGAPSPILFAGLTPGLVGLYQMNFQVPAGLTAGDITIVVTQNGQSSNQTVLPYQP
jgi:uncharacterized protein (TIGR03437 family)